MLVAIIPFFTMGQKRSKKGKAKTTTTNASYEFMVIKGYAMMEPIPEDMKRELDGPDGPEIKAKLSLRESRLMIAFEYDYTDNDLVKQINAINKMRPFKSMAHAVNVAAKYGWEFIQAYVLPEGNAKIHYYYMKRKN